MRTIGPARTVGLGRTGPLGRIPSSGRCDGGCSGWMSVGGGSLRCLPPEPLGRIPRSGSGGESRLPGGCRDRIPFRNGSHREGAWPQISRICGGKTAGRHGGQGEVGERLPRTNRPWGPLSSATCCSARDIGDAGPLKAHGGVKTPMGK